MTHTFDGLDLLSLVLLVVYVWIMVKAYRAVRREPFAPPRPAVSLACRLAPYRGGWIARTPAEPTSAFGVEFATIVSCRCGETTAVQYPGATLSDLRCWNCPPDEDGELIAFPSYSLKAV